MDNIFYSLTMQENLSGKSNYHFEIFSYNGSYMDLINAVRNYDTYNFADDEMYTFIDIDIGEFFIIILNEYDNLETEMNNILKDRTDNLIKLKTEGTSEVARLNFELLSTRLKAEKYLLKFALLELFTDNKTTSQVEYIKSMENNNIISHEIMTKYKKDIGITYNTSIIHFESNNPTYYFETLCDVLQFDLLQLISNKINIKKCLNCGKYFIPKSRSDEIYCDYEDESGKTCRQKGYENKVNNDVVLKEYRKIYKTQNARKQRNKHKPNIEDAFKKWHINSKEILKKCQNNEISVDNMIEQIRGTDWMRGEK